MGVSLLMCVLAAESISGLLNICFGEVAIGVVVKVLYDLELAAVWLTVEDLCIEHYPYIVHLLCHSNCLDLN